VGKEDKKYEKEGTIIHANLMYFLWSCDQTATQSPYITTEGNAW
jgi:hypothetical protein